MSRKILIVVLLCGIFLIPSDLSYAKFKIKFNEAGITPSVPDSDKGDYDHSLTTPFGDITFNGRIWKKLQGEKIGDHSPGKDGLFLKNTQGKAGKKVVTMDFGFDVDKIKFYWFAFEDTRAYFTVYDINGNKLKKKTRDGSEAWRGELKFSDYSDPIRRMKFWVKEDGKKVGNEVAIDDLKIFASETVPEPSTLALFGLGSLGAALFRRRKHKK